MAALSELLVKIGVDAEDLKGGVAKAAESVEENIGKITAAGVAAGAGMEAFARGQQDSNQTLSRTAVVSGESSDALRELAVELSDGQTAASDNADAFELLAQKGFDSREEFEQLTPQINDFADAVGKDSTAAIESADKLLSPFGDSLADVGDNTDQMTRLMAETDVPMGTLERNLGRVPDELQGLEFGLDDAAAGIEHFRDEGYSGQEAVREFRRAVDDSEGDMDAFLESIGMTADEWEGYQDAVEPTVGLTEEMAEANAESVTPMQELQQHAENLMFEYGALADMAGTLAPVLLALGPIMKAVTAAKWLFSAALWASPITWIVLGILLLIGVIVLIIYYWDEIAEATAAAWDWIVEKLAEAWDWIVELFTDAWEWLVDLVTGIWESIVDGFWAGVDWIVEAVQDGLDWIVDLFMDWHPLGIIISHWDAIVDAFHDGVDWAVDLVMGLVDDCLDFLEGLGEIPGMVGDFFSDMVSNAAGFISDLLSDVADIPGNITSALGDLGSLLTGAGRSVIQGLIDGITGMISNLGSSMSNVASTIRSYLPFSPAAEGPLSGGGAPEVSGASITDNLGEGILSEMSAIDQAADALMRPLDEQMDMVRAELSGVTQSVQGAVQHTAPVAQGSSTQTLELDLTGADEEFKKFMRKIIRASGGNVQRVLGQK